MNKIAYSLIDGVVGTPLTIVWGHMRELELRGYPITISQNSKWLNHHVCHYNLILPITKINQFKITNKQNQSPKYPFPPLVCPTSVNIKIIGSNCILYILSLR